uniref:SPK domain-containing protein n=1 Tax=Parastrongyloides trichosuri TaxID=131310 RepID=A0A0N4ZTA8_PARTI
MEEEVIEKFNAGGKFNIIWIVGDLGKKKLTFAERRKLIACDFNEFFDDIEMFISRRRVKMIEKPTFKIPEYKMYRLIYGATRGLPLFFEDQIKSLKKCTDIIIRHSTEEKRVVPSIEESKVLFDDEEIVEVTDIRRKRKRASPPSFRDWDMYEVVPEDIAFPDISPPPADVPSIDLSVSPKRRKKSMFIEQKRMEISEMIDIIREATREREDVADLTREAFLSNQTLRELSEMDLSGNGENYCDRVLNDESAQVHLYLHKVLLVHKNLIDDGFIERVSEKLGRTIKLKANTLVPPDIYEKFNLIKEGKLVLVGPDETGLIPTESQVQVLRGDETISIPYNHEPAVEGIISPHEISPVSIRRGISVSPEIIPLPEPERKTPPRKVRERKTPTSVKRQRQPRVSPSEAFYQMESISEKINFCKGRKHSIKQRTINKLDEKIDACEKMIYELVGLDTILLETDQLYNQISWFNVPQKRLKIIKENHGSIKQMFYDMEMLLLGENNEFVISEINKERFENILFSLYEFLKPNINFGIYTFLSDCSAFGLLTSHPTTEWLKRWIEEYKSVLSQSPLAEYDSYFEAGIVNFPRYLSKSYMQPDFTNSLKTFIQDFKDISRGTSGVVCRFRKKDCLRRILLSKERGIGETSELLSDAENQYLMEQIIKNIVVSDNTFGRNFFSTPFTEGLKNVQYQIVRDHEYNPSGTIVFSDMIQFLDYVYPICYEKSDIISNLLYEMLNSEDTSSLYLDEIPDDEYDSRLYEIYNTVLYDCEKLKQNLRSVSEFENEVNIGCIMFPSCVTRMVGDFDNESITSALDVEIYSLTKSSFPTETERFLYSLSYVFDEVIMSFIDYQKDLAALIRMSKFDISFLLPRSWYDNFDFKDKGAIKRPIQSVEEIRERSKRSRIESELLVEPHFLPEDEGFVKEIEDVSELIPEASDGSIIFQALESLTIREKSPSIREEFSPIREEFQPTYDKSVEEPEPTLRIENGRTMELTRLMMDNIIKSYIPIEFEYTFGLRDKKVYTEQDVLEFAKKQCEPPILPESEELQLEPTPEEELPVPIFVNISLISFRESPEETLKKVENIVGSKKTTTFKKLVKDYQKKPPVAKSFANLLLLTRKNGKVDLKQVSDNDIKIKLH